MYSACNKSPYCCIPLFLERTESRTSPSLLQLHSERHLSTSASNLLPFNFELINSAIILDQITTTNSYHYIYEIATKYEKGACYILPFSLENTHDGEMDDNSRETLRNNTPKSSSRLGHTPERMFSF